MAQYPTVLSITNEVHGRRKIHLRDLHGQETTVETRQRLDWALGCPIELCDGGKKPADIIADREAKVRYLSSDPQVTEDQKAWLPELQFGVSVLQLCYRGPQGSPVRVV